LKPEELDKPGLAAYYGVFLAAAGDKSRAAEYLKKVRRLLCFQRRNFFSKMPGTKLTRISPSKFAGIVSGPGELRNRSRRPTAPLCRR
jgi:hypothetical protein